MESRSISTNEFKKLLSEELSELCDERDWNYDHQTERGYAFQHWCAKLVAGTERTYDVDPDDAVLLTKDLKADFVFEDTNAKHILIGQCKHVRQGRLVDETEVNDFFSRHKYFMDPAWVAEHGSQQAVTALIDYRDLIDSGWSVSFWFFTTGKASERTKTVERKRNEDYEEQNLNIACRLYDFSGLKEYYVTSKTLEQSIPETVELDLPTGCFFEKDDPHPTVIAVVKGNALRDLARQHREALYAWNIRGYLGNQGINKAIGETARNRPTEFFYFNNGVSAICTSYDLEGNRIRARDFQIINGAQTVSTLRNVQANPDIEVLFRLTKTLDVKTEKGFNQDIIQFNNTQNQIKVSDFRSNDQIQMFLEQALSDRNPGGPLPKLRYVRKRMVGKRGVGAAIKLEDFAKIRFSFLYEPTLVHSAPKSLWSLRESGGVYEKAFGVDGKLESKWSTITLDEALLAYAFYTRVDQEASQVKRRDAEMAFLKRLRFHGVALAGLYVRKVFGDRSEEARRLIRNKQRFEKSWREFWGVARGVLVDVYSSGEEDGLSVYAFLRSKDRWHQMERRLRRHLTLLNGVAPL